MKKLAIVCAGQGSQYPGMALDFIDEKALSLEHLTDANTILGFDIYKTLSHQELIHQTRYTQPLVLLSTIAIFEYIKTLNINFCGTLGFSLGEYSALYVSGVLSYHDVLTIVNDRAKLMDHCATKKKGSMAAIIGLKSHEVDSICQSCTHEVYVANYNSPEQIVISGSEEGVLEASQKALAMGAKRAMKLSVSGAFHSPLMHEASTLFVQNLAKVSFHDPIVPIYLNTTAKPLDMQRLKQEMIKQITSPVRFTESIKAMKDDGFTHFLEIGPGKTLSGLIKKIDLDLEVMNIDKIENYESVKGWLKTHGFIT